MVKHSELVELRTMARRGHKLYRAVLQVSRMAMMHGAEAFARYASTGLSMTAVF